MKFKKFYSLALENTSSNIKKQYYSRSENPDCKQGDEKNVWSKDDINSIPYHNFKFYDKVIDGLPEEAEPNGILAKTRELASWTTVKTYYMTCVDDHTRRNKGETGPMHIAATLFYLPEKTYGKDYPPYLKIFTHYDNNKQDSVWRETYMCINTELIFTKLVLWWAKHREKVTGLKGAARDTWNDILS